MLISDVNRLMMAPVGVCGLDSCLSAGVSGVEESLIIMHLFIILFSVGVYGRTSFLKPSGCCLSGLDDS